MNELEGMNLLELIDLKERIVDFRSGKDFEVDVSGILELFK